MAKSQQPTKAQPAAKMPIEDRPECYHQRKAFCFVCAKYRFARQRAPFTNRLKDAYKAKFGVSKIKNVDACFAGGCICTVCKKSFKKFNKRPAVWKMPPNHEQCYICTVSKNPKRLSPKMQRNKKDEIYPAKMNVELPSSTDKDPLPEHDCEYSEAEHVQESDDE